ncbi:MAG: electron transport complex subunit RsxD [Gallionellaceae bacterium]
MFSPFISKASSVREIMFKVLLALVPAIAAYMWYFGPAILISLTLASITALATEAAMLKLRQRPVMPFLSDNSALLTAWLIALSIPPLAPWWLVVVGTMFAIAIAKHLYGGLGNNTFNPAMTAYAVLIISFPAAMSSWIAPHGYGQKELSWLEQLHYIFAGQLPANFTLDAVSMATPLDMLKTQLHAGHALTEIMQQPIFGQLGGHGGEMVALAYIAGGIYLLANRIISWHLPVAFLLTLFATAGIFHLVDPAHYAPPLFHWFSGGAMLAAFFILTDPVTSPTTLRGKLIFAAGAGFLTYIIRMFGNFPDGIAFATLLMNICVPLIDVYTQPPVFGNKTHKFSKKGEQ